MTLGFVAALSACGGTGGGSPASPSPRPAVFTAADDMTTVEVSVGERFTVSLQENPTTGYEWDMIAGPGLALVGDEFVAPSPSPSPLEGAGGTHSWVFRAEGQPVQVEESIFFASPDGIRATQQLVIASRASQMPEIRWSLTREPTETDPE